MTEVDLDARVEILRGFANRLEAATDAYHAALDTGDDKVISAAWWVRQNLILAIESYIRSGVL